LLVCVVSLFFCVVILKEFANIFEIMM